MVPKDPWTFRLVLDTLGTDQFDIVSLPFSIQPAQSDVETLSPSIPQQSNSPDQPLSNSPPSTIHLVKQYFNYTDTLGEANDTMPASLRQMAIKKIGGLTIDHYSSPSIQPVLQFPTTYSLGSDGRMEIVEDPSIDEHPPQLQLGKREQIEQILANVQLPPAGECEDSAEINSSLSQQLQQATQNQQKSAINTTINTTTTTTLLRSHNFSDRHYSTMPIEQDTKVFLNKERKSLVQLGFNSSQLLPLSQTNTSKMIAQHMVNNRSDPNKETSNININPLSSQPHHFHLQFNPPADLSSSYPPFTSHRLFSFSIMNYSTLQQEIEILTKFRSLIFKSAWNSFVSLFKTTQSAQLRFSTPLYFTTPHELHTNRHLGLSTPSLPLPTTPTTSSNDSNVNINTTKHHRKSSKHFEQMPSPHSKTPHLYAHTITSCTVDIPSSSHNYNFDFSNVHKLFNAPHFFSVNPFWSLNHCPNNQNIVGPHQNRNLLPYFMLIVHDLDDDDDDENKTNNTVNNDNNDAHRVQKEQPQTTLPSTSTSNAHHADLMTSYLASCIPQGCSMYDGDVALHYVFTTREKLKSTMIECIQTAIGIRLDHYVSFDPVYR
jgi:hypothetical protein